MNKVYIYTDGSSRGNPGPGGYGAVLKFTDDKGELHMKEMSAGYKFTTNNRMEIMGAIVALEALKFPCEVELTSDSAYLIHAFTEGWLTKWQAAGWKRGKEPVKNIDLWKKLLLAAEPHTITWNWVKGHAGHPENERCDQLAQGAADGNNLQDDTVEEI